MATLLNESCWQHEQLRCFYAVHFWHVQSTKTETDDAIDEDPIDQQSLSSVLLHTTKSRNDELSLFP
eukprot:4438317-Amphidinium_carterae.2